MARHALALKITIPDWVLSTELQKEGVLLNLETGQYYGLDEVGMDMWKVLRAGGNLEAARAAMIEQYDVTEDVLARDLEGFIAALAARTLIEITDR